MPGSRRFHLGEEIDVASLAPAGLAAAGRPFDYDPDHLTTHGVCFGMTGSGKTGLCVVLIEEAIRSGIPCLIIDPKGDLANLALTFPALQASDYAPWVDPAEASRRGMTVDSLAAAESERWRAGLAAAGLSGRDIAAMRAASEIAVFTPGSTAGRPVNVLGGFAPPSVSWEEDAELIRSRIVQTVAPILDLAGIDADPITSPEAIFLATAFERAWKRGERVTIESLIRELGHPGVDKLGVMDLDDLYPKPRRMETATALNALVAAPAFAAWTTGTSLDPAALLRSAGGAPRASIFYLAHLSDRERSFFVASLLASVVTWMRSRGGSSTLGALVYMDEIFGYLPPHPANPPSKAPLLTLLKQARAFGVGVLLATQNPVDVDYKGLANAGTWFLGRLQTDQDRERLIDGMSGAAGAGIDRATLGRLLSALPPRSFVVHDAREGRIRVVTSRWAMSYLRGPLTKEEIRKLPEARESDGSITSSAATARGDLVVRPVVPGGVSERFSVASTADASLAPHLYASVRITFEDRKAGIREVRERTIALAAETSAASPDWALAQAPPATAASMTSVPPQGATYDPLPEAWQRSATFRQAASSLKGWLAANETLPVLRNPVLALVSKPGEARADFESRCRVEAGRRLDEDTRAYQSKMEEKSRRLCARVGKEEADVGRDVQEAQARKTQEAIGIGGSVLGALLGSRRSLGSSVLGASQRRRMSQRADAQVERSRMEAEAARAELEAFEGEARAALDGIQNRWAEAAGSIEETLLRPRKSAIEVLEIGVLWLTAPRA